jgi:hypothetical protein
LLDGPEARGYEAPSSFPLADPRGVRERKIEGPDRCPAAAN